MSQPASPTLSLVRAADPYADISRALDEEWAQKMARINRLMAESDAASQKGELNLWR